MAYALASAARFVETPCQGGTAAKAAAKTRRREAPPDGARRDGATGQSQDRDRHMSDIEELEGRISAALDRIAKGIDGLDSPETAPETDAVSVGDLQRQLDEERLANAQLEERVKRLKARQDTKMAALEGEVAEYRDRLAGMDRDLQRLRQVNAELRNLTGLLRAAATEGVTEAHLINKAMMAELDAVRATQAADAAEIDAVLGELRPIIEEAE